MNIINYNLEGLIMKLFNKIFIFTFFIPVILMSEVPWHTVSFSILDNANSATFHMNKYFFGIDAQNLSIDGSNVSQVWTFFPAYEYNGTMYESYYAYVNHKQSISISAWLLTPRFGKRFNYRSNNKIQTYGDIAGYLSIPFVEVSADDSDVEINNEDLENVEDIVDNLLDFIGFKFSYGITYKINDQISFSTAVGYNHVFADLDMKSENIELDTNMGNTFTTFSINYSF